MPVIKVSLLSLILIICLGGLDKCENTTPPEYRRLFRLPREQQAEEFKKYPLEQQVDIYIYAMQGVEPPLTEFAGFLASNGKKIIPLLLERLKDVKNDRIRYYFIRVFDEIHMNHCSLKDEQEVIQAIRDVISEMKDPSYRHLCELYLKTILEKPSPSKSC